jgi:hypothetical protein
VSGTAPDERDAQVDRWLTAGLCGVAMALAVIATWQGPGLSIDSVNYIVTGINFGDGRGLRALADQPLTAFPPGLPLTAALGEVIGIGAENMLRVVSVASFGAMVALGHRLLARIVPNRGVVRGATVLLAVSPILLAVSMMAWSEPPFIAVTLGFLVVLGGVCERGVIGRRDVAALVALSSAGFLFRYIGMALVPLGAITLLVSVRPLDRRAVWRIVSFGLWSAVVPILCMLRNHAADGSYLGRRLPSSDSPTDVAYRVAVTFGRWIYPVDGPTTRTAAFIGAAGLALGVGALLVALPRRHHLSRRAQANLIACGVYLVVYTAYLVGAALFTPLAPLNTRLMSPIYVPAVVVLAACVAAGLRRIPSQAWRTAAGATLVVGIALQGAAAVGDARDAGRDGVEYNRTAVEDSQLAAETARLVDATPGAVVYSNVPHALWRGTGIRPILWSPRETAFRGARVTGDLDALEWRVACSWPATYLSLFTFGSQRVIGLDEIRESVDVERVAVADDGAVFRLTSRSQPDCDGDPPVCSIESVPWRCEGDRD